MLRIALAQCRQTADFDANAATIFRFLERAIAAQAQIVCFPEAQTVGYRVDISHPHAPSPTARLDELHTELARRCGAAQIACILGT
ncbi:MAG: nitrilase-related carbon-nitrogen hydrolase, partial [Candidatus Latescibacteria bacterium]|nr:nitrilase-related carbon-nitrogen hydrolase [Candidatus Latescibacterota bacterium]